MRCHPHWGDSERQALSLSISLFTSLLIGYRLEPLGKLRMSPTPGPVRGSLARFIGLKWVGTTFNQQSDAVPLTISCSVQQR